MRHGYPFAAGAPMGSACEESDDRGAQSGASRPAMDRRCNVLRRRIGVHGNRQIAAGDERSKGRWALVASMMVRHSLIGIALRLVRIPIDMDRAGTVDRRSQRNLLSMHRRRHKQRRDEQTQNKASLAKHKRRLAREERLVT